MFQELRQLDKAKGRLGNTALMAMQLQQLTGIEPLSIDQTQFREQIPSEPDDYTELVKNFRSKGPFVLVDRTTGKSWSTHPEQHDVNVLLPPPADQHAVKSGYVLPSTIVHDTVRLRAWDIRGRTLSEQVITISKR